MQENELISSVSTEEQDGACTHTAAWLWGAPCTALYCSDRAAQFQAEQCAVGLWPDVCLSCLAQHLRLLTWHGEAFRLWIRLLKGGGEGGVLFVLHRCFLRRTSLLSLCISQWHWNVCRVRSRCWQRRALLLQDAGKQQGTAGAFAAFTATHSSDRNYPRASLT